MEREGERERARPRHVCVAIPVCLPVCSSTELHHFTLRHRELCEMQSQVYTWLHITGRGRASVQTCQPPDWQVVSQGPGQVFVFLHFK